MLHCPYIPTVVTTDRMVARGGDFSLSARYVGRGKKYSILIFFLLNYFSSTWRSNAKPFGWQLVCLTLFVILCSRVERCLDTGISIAALTGEGRENTESSFTPTQKVDIPYNTFGMLDMCDPLKEIFMQEKVLLYYKYNNNPVSCIKIFHSDYRIKSFGIR